MTAMRKIDGSKFARDLGPADPAEEGADAVPAPSPADFGPAPQLEWIAIDRLVVDEAYQRAIAPQGERNVRTIAATFDWRKFAPVIVAPVVGGLYAIVDGQHRTTGAAARGIRSVPCQIIQADRRAQAEAFNAINGIVTKVTKTQQFRAALTAGDPVAQRLARVTAEAGVVVLFTHKPSTAMKPNETIALDAVKRSVAKFGEEVATIGLRAIVASAGDLGGYLRAPIITAVAEVLAIRPGWLHDDRLEAAFMDLDLDDAWRKAAAAAAQRRGVLTGDVLQAAITTHLSERIDNPAWRVPAFPWKAAAAPAPRPGQRSA